MTIEFTYEDPPESKRGRGGSVDWEAIALIAKRGTGRWLKLGGSFSNGFASQARTKLVAGYEVAGRSAGKDEDGKTRFSVYVRYIDADGDA